MCINSNDSSKKICATQFRQRGRVFVLGLIRSGVALSQLDALDADRHIF